MISYAERVEKRFPSKRGGKRILITTRGDFKASAVSAVISNRKLHINTSREEYLDNAKLSLRAKAVTLSIVQRFKQSSELS